MYRLVSLFGLLSLLVASVSMSAEPQKKNYPLEARTAAADPENVPMFDHLAKFGDGMMDVTLLDGTTKKMKRSEAVKWQTATLAKLDDELGKIGIELGKNPGDKVKTALETTRSVLTTQKTNVSNLGADAQEFKAVKAALEALDAIKQTAKDKVAAGEKAFDRSDSSPLLDDIKNIDTKFDNMWDKLELMERRYDRAVLGNYVREKLTRLVNSNAFCKAQAQCDGEGRKENADRVTDEDMNDLFFNEKGFLGQPHAAPKGGSRFHETGVEQKK